MKNNPSVTVLMSVYNGERWLEDSITSVLSQTFEDFEFIIVNDGSTDRSSEIINRFSIIDYRIIIIDKSNTGLADSLNYGIQQARGQWIARIDADDLCEKERLKYQHEKVKKNSSIVLVGTGLTLIDEYGGFIKEYVYPKSNRALLNNLTSNRKFFAHSSAFYHKSTVKKLGGYRTRIKLAQDKDLWLRLSEVGLISSVDLPLVKIRKHENQVSHENRGYDQRIYSQIAITSYWLRQAGFVDPVTTVVKEDDFEKFRAWHTQQLDKTHFFDYIDDMQKIKQFLLSDESRFSSYLEILKYFMKKPMWPFRYLVTTVFGMYLSKCLAAEWVKTNRNIG